MEKNWIQDRINFLESFIKDNAGYPDQMKERDINLIQTLKKFIALPEARQKELRPVLDRTFERHKNIGKSIKVINYYFESLDLSLNFKKK